MSAGAERIIEVWEILFYLTEVFELAARLALGSAGDDPMAVDVRLHGLDGRTLVAGTPSRELHGSYRSTMSTIKQKKENLSRDLLVAEPRRIAVEVARDVFLRFGWKASEQVLADYQRELPERR